MMLLEVMMMDHHNDNKGVIALKHLESTATDGTGFHIFRALRMVLIIKCHKLSLFIINLEIVNMMLLVVMMMDHHNDNKGARALKHPESADSD